MKIYFVRHGEATHLEEDWHKSRISRKEFIKKMIEWEHVTLTELGKSQAINVANNLPNDYKCIYTSPLLRTKQTADRLNVLNKEVHIIHDLKEIVTTPPKIFMFMKLSIFTWIHICIVFSLLKGQVFRMTKKAKRLYNFFFEINEDIVVVSHAMRIRSFVYYAYFIPKLKVVKKDFSTCGISVIEIK